MGSDRLACNFTPTTYVSSLPGGEDRLLHPWGGGCPQGVHPDQSSRRSEQDGTWKDAAASRGEQETRSWTLPRPQLSLREEEQASAEPAHLPGRAEDEGRGGPAEAGGDRARQLRM